MTAPKILVLVTGIPHDQRRDIIRALYTAYGLRLPQYYLTADNYCNVAFDGIQCSMYGGDISDPQRAREYIERNGGIFIDGVELL